MTAAMPSPRSLLPAYLVALGGIGLFSIMDMVIKALAIALGTFPTLWWRSLIGLAMSAALFLIHRPAWPDRRTLRLHLVRGLITAAMAFLFFWGLVRVPMAQAVALTFIAPLLALYLAALLLGERIGARTLTGSVAAFAGVVVIVVGQAQADLGREALLGSVAILVGALLYAYNIVLMRQQALVAKPVEIAFFQSLFVALAFSASLPLAWPVAPPTGHWVELVAAAVLAQASLLLLAWAYARAGAAFLSTSEYSSFLWAMALGWLRFGEPVTPFTLAGAALIVVGCLYAIRDRGEPGEVAALA